MGANLLGRPTKQQFFNEYLNFSISDDRMQAQMIYSIYPEEPLTLSDFTRFFTNQSIVFGVKDSLLREVCLSPGSYTGRALVIAEGTLPVNGEDSVIIWNFDQKVTSSDTTEATNERIDFKDVDNVTNVKAGELLATKKPLTEGTPGMNIMGSKIEAKAGKNIPFKIGKNVVLDETGLKAYATIDGQASFTEKEKINVFPLYEVKGDVDYSVGNIDFVGSVIIRGNVLTGFSVKAGGDLRILGEVEGAELEATGNIEIRYGIFGQGKGFVKAGRNLIASYINQADVVAHNDVIVGSIMHSNVRAGHKVVCRQGKGLIVGGRIQAGELIDVNVIGNVSQTPTVVEVGVSPDIVNEYNSIKERILQIEADLDKANKAVTVLNRQLVTDKSLPANKMELRSNLMNAIQSLQKTLPELETRKIEIEESLELVNNASVNIQNIAFPGTKIVFGKYVRYLKLEHSKIAFRLSDGEISTIPL